MLNNDIAAVIQLLAHVFLCGLMFLIPPPISTHHLVESLAHLMIGDAEKIKAVLLSFCSAIVSLDYLMQI